MAKDLDPIQEFKDERSREMAAMASDPALAELSLEWMKQAYKHRYPYNFNWLGRPIIKFPQDIVAFQEVVWETKPDLIIETGIAHGGSLMLSASLLETIGGPGEVIGIDIDIRAHNRKEIEAHPLSRRITMFEGSSIDETLIAKVRDRAARYDRIMVVLDSHHTHDHVAAELLLYSPLVSNGCYLILPDTFIENFPPGFFDRSWDVGNNPLTALREFLKTNSDFEIDERYDQKLLISESINGYLRRKSG